MLLRGYYDLENCSLIILVVEDDRSLSRGIVYALEKDGYQVYASESKEEGLKLWQKHHPHLILLDVMLPDGSGFDVCQTIRRTSTVPIIFLTASDEEVNIVMGLDLGGDDYVTKPFRVRELLSRIRATLRRQQDSAQLLLESGAISLHIVEHRTYKNGVQVNLTPLEFRLCEVLLSHRGQVLSREQLLQVLWDIDGEFIDDNTLSVHIRRIREKLEDDPSKPIYIVTVRGVGYRWGGEA